MLKQLINLKKSSLEKEYFLIRALIMQLDTKIKMENEQIVKTIQSLEKEVPTYVQNIIELNTEINELRSQLQLKNIDNEPPFNMEDDLVVTIDENDLTIKKLYRIISSKCHPDRTDDISLHNLFILASEAYNHHNYNIILEIYNQLLDNSSNINFSNISIEKKLELIRSEYETRKTEFNSLTGSNGYIIKTLIKNNNINQARRIFLNLLFNQILELEELKKQLTTNLNKKI